MGTRSLPFQLGNDDDGICGATIIIKSAHPM